MGLESSIAVERPRRRDTKNKLKQLSMSNFKLLKMLKSVTGIRLSLSMNHFGPWELEQLLVQIRRRKHANKSEIGSRTTLERINPSVYALSMVVASQKLTEIT